jgi:pyruvate,water dikinase
VNSSITVVRGLPVSPGLASGVVRALRSPAEITQAKHGEILVVPNSHPGYAIALAFASGLVCEVGGRLSHTCIVALEMGIPCITQADCALELLEPLDYVWLDANEGVVYAIM